MFCNQCGVQLPDGTSVCSACGAVLPTQPAKPVEAQTEPTVAVAYPEQYAAPQPQYAAPQTEPSIQTSPNPEYFAQAQFEPRKKKKSKKGLIIGISAGVAAIAAAVWLFFFSPWFGDNEFASKMKGDYIKNNGTSDEYAQFVEDKTLGGYVDSASSAYDKVLNAISKSENTELAGKMQLDLVMSEDAIIMIENLLKEQSGVQLDLDWINSISLLMDVNANDELAQVGAGVSMDGQLLADLDIILDSDEKELYIALPTFSDKYLVGPIEVDESSMQSIDEMKAFIVGMKEYLPTSKQFDALLNKYLDLIVKNIVETSKSEETVEIGSLSKKLTVIEYNIDTDTLAAVLRAVLEAAKDDEELAGYIKNVAKYLEKQDMIEDADDVYDAFKDGVRDLISDMKDASGENQKLLTIVNYVDDSHRVVGRTFKPYGTNESVSFVTIRDGDKFATRIDAAGAAKIEGEGTDKKGIVNAEYSLKVNGAKILDIAVIDYDSAKLDEGYLNGTIRITPTSTLLTDMNLDPTIATLISTADISLELKATSDDKECKYEINLLSGSKVYFGLQLTATSEQAQTITKPSSDKVVASENVTEWLNSLDFNKFIDALNKTSMPKELVNMINGLMSGKLPG